LVGSVSSDQFLRMAYGDNVFSFDCYCTALNEAHILHRCSTLGTGGAGTRNQLADVEEK
jgi:hypothetical protein